MAFLSSPLLIFPSASFTRPLPFNSPLVRTAPGRNANHVMNDTKRCRSRTRNAGSTVGMSSSTSDVQTSSPNLHTDSFVNELSAQQGWDALLANALVDNATVEGTWFKTDGRGATKETKRRGSLEKGINRKPHGYWNDLTNVERELEGVNEKLGRAGKKIVPKLTEMKMMGRGDLVAAIAKHGGVKKVADDLRWGRGGKTRRKMSTVAFPPGMKRAKVLRRPRKYWENIERVKMEIGAFVAEYGVKGVMPTQKQFYQFGRADLAQAAGRHGGVRILAEKMGLKCRRKPKGSRYWRDFDVLKEALLQFSERNCPGCMPTGDELKLEGQGALTSAIALHGGFPEVAARCGLIPRNGKKQGAPNVWNEKRLRRELFAFLMRWQPQFARNGWMPTERMLRKEGRNDLSYAISKFGGFGVVAEKVGLTMKKKGVFKSEKGVASEQYSL